MQERATLGEQAGDEEPPEPARGEASVEEILEANAAQQDLEEGQEPGQAPLPSSPAEAQEDTGDGSGAPPGEAEAAAALAAPIPIVRTKAELVADVIGGRLTFYGRGFFTATCNNARHGKCIKTLQRLCRKKATARASLGIFECLARMWSRPAHESCSLGPVQLA